MSGRPYRSSKRAEQSERTRRDILEAARRLFVVRGYTGTSIAAVAREAGVAVPTVYASVGAKPELVLGLQQLIDEAGDVGELQRRIGASGDPVEIVGLAAAIRRRIMEGAGDVVLVMAASAPTNPEVAEAYERGQQASRIGIARVVGRLDTLSALRPDLDAERATDTTYALLHHAVYDRLVNELGWSADDYEAWCADALRRLLLRDPG